MTAQLAIIVLSMCASAVLCADAPEKAVRTYEKDGVKIEVLEEATDCKHKSRCKDTLTWHYKGYFTDGKVFDTSVGRDPYWATLCTGSIIRGVDIGMSDMCEGERRRMTIPSELGYGKSGTNGIPGGATLLFDVELLLIDQANSEL